MDIGNLDSKSNNVNILSQSSRESSRKDDSYMESIVCSKEFEIMDDRNINE